MGLNRTYPVHNDSGAHLVLQLGGAAVGGSSGVGSGALPATPVFLHSLGKPGVIGFGNGSFPGSGVGLATFAVGHGLGSAITPLFVQIMPALASGGAWTAQFGQYQAADSSNFYIVATNPSGGSFDGGSTYFYNFLAVGQIK